MSGWIKLHRDIQDHWIFKKEEYLKAWILLLIKANHKDYKTLFLDQLVEVKRGEVVVSYAKFGAELMWSSSKVRRFLKMLEKDKMIFIFPEKKWTHLSILNYETYQHNGKGEETDTKQTRNGVVNNQRMKKNDKNVKKKTISQKDQLNNIFIEIEELQKEFPYVKVALEFQRMRDWLKATGKQYKNYKSFFKNWLRKADENSPKEDKVLYVYTCGVCGKVKEKNEYRDMFVMCCEKQIDPIKEYV